ncbi:hypothetical protein ISP15_00100 [Dyella jejuensis]|uniref:Uncharacterized protein n=1 Tax=Dyella jejuensis TaxID=1432009 RepID=A0ABW8JCC1_9GAMM
MRLFAHARAVLRDAAARWCGVMLLLLACMPGAAKAVSCANVQPLQLGNSVVILPPGTVGQPYQYTLHATGGVPPYTYHAGSLPPGVTISPGGVLSGTPSSLPLIAVFVAGVRDRHGCIAQQTYKLAIVAPWQPSPAPVPKPAPAPKPPRPPAPAPKPLPPTPLATLPLADTLAAPFSPQSAMDTYLLSDAIFKDKDVLAALKQMSANAASAGGMAPADDPDDTGKDAAAGQDDAADDGSSGDATSKPAASKDDASNGLAKDDSSGAAARQPADAAIEADAQAQFQRMLQPLIGVEYPGQELFAAALDTRLCQFSKDLIVAAANAQGRPAPLFKDSDCPPDWAKLATQDDYVPHDPLPWQQVPQWLMTPALRSLLIDKARQSHPLLNPPAPEWTGKGCGCVRQLSGEIYGFYPYWHNQDKPLPLDFSLLSRISVFALWFKDSGDLVEPAWTTLQDTDFIRTAHRHRTALDYTLYHNDWGFLKDATDDDIKSVSERLAVQAANFIDTPLTDLASRSHAWVPGFANIERYGGGLTLYLDQMPAANDPLRPAFQRYLDRQVRELIAELRRRNRPYVLNIVLRDADLTGANGIWQVNAMTEYLRQAESVDPRGGSVASQNARARSSTNLTLRYLVLLDQPTEHSMREVLSTIDRDKNIDEEACRILLRRVIPIVSTGALTEPELTEDLAYASDNFGGAGFWSAPSLEQPAGRTTAARIRGSFLQRVPRAEQLNAWTCEYRWPLRMAAEALLLVWLIAFMVYQSSCRIRQIGLPYQLGLLLGAIAFLIVGALLLAGDPALAQVRQGNALLGLLLVALIATVAYHMLKPRVERP